MNELYNVKLLPTKDKRLIYVNNPKVACSSIKFSFFKLWFILFISSLDVKKHESAITIRTSGPFQVLTPVRSKAKHLYLDHL